MKTFTKVLLILLVSFVLVMGSNSLYAREDVKQDIKEKAACCKADAKEKAAPCKAHAHAEKTADSKAKCDSAHKTMYVCPVKGCTYKSDKPGKCPKCGKELVKKVIKYEVKTVYACPVKGCTYKSDKPGKCPKCGKELVKKAVCCTADKKVCDHTKHEHKHEKHEHKH